AAVGDRAAFVETTGVGQCRVHREASPEHPIDQPQIVAGHVDDADGTQDHEQDQPGPHTARHQSSPPNGSADEVSPPSRVSSRARPPTPSNPVSDGAPPPVLPARCEARLNRLLRSGSVRTSWQTGLLRSPSPLQMFFSFFTRSRSDNTAWQ